MSLLDEHGRDEMERMIWAAAFGARFVYDTDREDSRTIADAAVRAYRGLYPKTCLYRTATPVGLRELVYVATKEQGFADTLAKKCDELAAENKRLESENHNLKGEIVHYRAVR